MRARRQMHPTRTPEDPFNFSYYVGISLFVFSYYVGISLFIFSCYVGISLFIFSYYVGISLFIFSYYVGISLFIFSYYVGISLFIFSCYVGISLFIFSYYVGISLFIFSYYVGISLFIFSYYVGISLFIFSYYVGILFIFGYFEGISPLDTWCHHWLTSRVISMTNIRNISVTNIRKEPCGGGWLFYFTHAYVFYYWIYRSNVSVISFRMCLPPPPPCFFSFNNRFWPLRYGLLTFPCLWGISFFSQEQSVGYLAWIGSTSDHTFTASSTDAKHHNSNRIRQSGIFQGLRACQTSVLNMHTLS